MGMLMKRHKRRHDPPPGQAAPAEPETEETAPVEPGSAETAPVEPEATPEPAPTEKKTRKSRSS